MRKVIFTTTLLIFCVSIITAQTSKSISKSKGDSYLKDGDYNMASEMYINCMDEDDDCFFGYVQLLMDEKIKPQSDNELYGLLHEKADKGNAKAQYLLGTLYMEGKGGTPKRIDLAIENFNKAIKGGSYDIREKAKRAKLQAEQMQRDTSVNRSNSNPTRRRVNGEYVNVSPYESEDEVSIGRAVNNPQPSKGSFIIMPGISYGSRVSFTTMVGYAGSIGGYLKVKTSFNSKKAVTDGDNGDPNVFYSGQEVSGRFSFYGGVLFKTSDLMYINAGIGYGSKWEQLEAVDGLVFNIDSKTLSGVDPEIGIIFRFNHFMIGGGVNCIIGGGKTDVEGNLSVGFAF